LSEDGHHGGKEDAGWGIRKGGKMERKYKDILFYSGNNMVMFAMQNGWFYGVDLQQKNTFVYWSPDVYLRFNPYVEDGNKIPKGLKQKAEKGLQTFPLEPAVTEGPFAENLPNTAYERACERMHGKAKKSNFRQG
jgi:hypothetical protein